MKILIIKRDKIGDLILATPIFELIKSKLPSAELHLLANTYNGWIAENNPHIDHLWLYPRSREGGRGSLRALLNQIAQVFQLRNQHFDWIIVAGSYDSRRANLRARYIATGSTRIVAYCGKDTFQRGISDPLIPSDSGHEMVRMVALLAPLGIDVEATDIPAPSFKPRPDWVDAARRFLSEEKIDPDGYVLLGVGARRQVRQPEPAQITRWARVLHDRFGLHTVFIWTPGKRDDPFYPGDDDIAEAVLADRSPWIHPYRGDLGTVVGLTWLAKTSLYPDSGLMHVAAACPGGVVGLFADIEHSSSPVVWGPVGGYARVVVAPRQIAELADEEIMCAIEKNILQSSCVSHEKGTGDV